MDNIVKKYFAPLNKKLLSACEDFQSTNATELCRAAHHLQNALDEIQVYVKKQEAQKPKLK